MINFIKKRNITIFIILAFIVSGILEGLVIRDIFFIDPIFVKDSVTDSEVSVSQEEFESASEDEYSIDPALEQQISNFILETEDYKQHGVNPVVSSIYDAGTYCENCKLARVQYHNKENDRTGYSIDILLEKDVPVKILELRTWNMDESTTETKQATSEVKRGESLYGITLDNNGYMQFNNKIISKGMFDYLSENVWQQQPFTSLFIYNFPRYEKTYIFGCIYECNQYVLDRKRGEVREIEGFVKYFNPTILGYSKDGRYLTVWDYPDDGFIFAIFDIEKEKYIGQKWFDEIDIYDFTFTDNTNFTYKYTTPYEYANQEQTKSENVDLYVAWDAIYTNWTVSHYGRNEKLISQNPDSICETCIAYTFQYEKSDAPDQVFTYTVVISNGEKVAERIGE